MAIYYSMLNITLCTISSKYNQNLEAIYLYLYVFLHQIVSKLETNERYTIEHFTK